MVYRFEKILLIALITIFGILPLVAYPVFDNTAPKTANAPAEKADVFIVSSALEQLAAVATAFVVKPVYTMIALIVAIVLWKKTDMELKALKWAMLFFFIGENFCAANFLFSQNHDSHLLEYLHSLGMVFSFGFTAFALMEGIDRYALRYSDAKKSCALAVFCRQCHKFEDVSCALAAFCRQCHKFEDVSCGLQSFFIFLGIAGAVVALLPFGAQLHFVSYNTSIWGRPIPISIRWCTSLLKFAITPCWLRRYF
jgi:hypothetical protein